MQLSSRTIYRCLIIFFGFAVAKALLSCKNDSKIAAEIEGIPVDVELKLFHQEFAEADTTELDQLRDRFPNLLPAQVPDEFWNEKLSGRDTIFNVLEQTVVKRKFDFAKLEKQIQSVQKHVKFYFPDFQELDAYTIISEVNYDKKVTVRPDGIYIAIDTYLGSDNELYQGISAYKRENLNIEEFPADLSLTLAGLFVKPDLDRTFLSTMVYYGKLHYLQELFTPQSEEAHLFDTTAEKFMFMQESENQIWRYFVDQEMLYSTDQKLYSRFIADAPFSKFYLEIDRETPGGVGRYIGYRIVQSFMENNDINIDQMLALPADKILNQSGYKPL